MGRAVAQLFALPVASPFTAGSRLWAPFAGAVTPAWALYR